MYKSRQGEKWLQDGKIDIILFSPPEKRENVNFYCRSTVPFYFSSARWESLRTILTRWWQNRDRFRYGHCKKNYYRIAISARSTNLTITQTTHFRLVHSIKTWIFRCQFSHHWLTHTYKNKLMKTLLFPKTWKIVQRFIRSKFLIIRAVHCTKNCLITMINTVHERTLL